MTLLELREAACTLPGGRIAGPFSATLAEGDRLAVAAESVEDAQVLAMLACGMLTASSGTVYVGAFDARIQPVQVKRIAAFVPHEPLQAGFASFARYIEYRADLWGVPRAQAIVRARSLLEQLAGMHEAFSFPIAGALCVGPRLLVLDRPLPAHANAIVAAAGACAIFSTHAGENEATAFFTEAAAV
ncbi:MAG TPA: hypothetical protein VFL13_03735 [Candidatus Baltobacteraceae bacterium]|nr:hypothetical protein [Candidatus Baltobacteraceae bacterium]